MSSTSVSRSRRRSNRPEPSFVQRLVPVLVLVAVMWVAEFADQALPGTWDYYGIRPWDTDHLLGILLSPFLHRGYEHLIANTGALLVLGGLVALSTRHLFAVTLGVVVLGGAGVWLFAPPMTVHIGASGLLYGYAAFLVVFGFVARRFWAALLGILVALTYGGLVWGVLPLQYGVSWQAHLFGAIAGVIMALVLGRRARAERQRLTTFV